ncbi:MAG: SEC-C metal-binding domain-containing protein, partial [Actinobacteria bacterium]|nr:SEC-C metal-binding domain-containing protein [Actinomycetota bacterium]
EGFNFDIRKHLVQYDDVLNKQREIIYKERRRILETTSKEEKALKEKNEELLKNEILEKIQNAISTIVSINNIQENYEEKTSPDEKIIQEFSTIIPFDEESQKQLIKQFEQVSNIEEKIDFLQKLAQDIYQKREEQMGKELIRQIERFVMLSVIDNLWMDHLDAIENLRQGIGLRGYGQRDPLIEYKNEAFKMFEQLMSAIDDQVVHRIYKIQVQQTPPPMPIRGPIITQAAGSQNQIKQNLQSRKSQLNSNSMSSNDSSKKKLGRNDPCWCGSGKKFKKCHYPNLS